jgi:ketosteroid isomerase-like protein
VTIAGLYAENAVFNAPEGTFHGRQAIEILYTKQYFGEAHSKNVVTLVNEAIAAGNEVRATGTWSDTFEQPPAGTIHAEGTYSWVLVHQGNTWRIRESTYERPARRSGPTFLKF